jgi:hypothetical protein
MNAPILTIFGDYSGDIHNSDDRLMVYAVLVLDDQLQDKVRDRHSGIIENLKRAGFTIDLEFELHTQSIVTQSGIWRHATYEQRARVLGDLKRTCVELRLPFVALLIDKDEGGVASLKTMQKTSKMTAQSMEDEIAKKLELEAPGINIQHLKADSLVAALGMLFGLCNGSIVHKKMSGYAKVIVDEQFFRQTDLWKGVFTLMRMYWQPLVRSGAFFTWQKDKQPEWRISDEVTQVKSYEYPEVQLADFVAYMIRTTKARGLQDYRRFCPLKSGPVKISDGVYVGLGP